MDPSETFAPVHDLSGSDSEPPKPTAKRSVKWRRSQEPKRPFYDEETIRRMLGNPKCHFKRKCLNQFVDDDAFQGLKQFRVEWADMRKLDQDTVEHGLQLSPFCIPRFLHLYSFVVFEI